MTTDKKSDTPRTDKAWAEALDKGVPHLGEEARKLETQLTPQ